jgi:hypothetical protein
MIQPFRDSRIQGFDSKPCASPLNRERIKKEIYNEDNDLSF